MTRNWKKACAAWRWRCLMLSRCRVLREASRARRSASRRKSCPRLPTNCCNAYAGSRPIWALYARGGAAGQPGQLSSSAALSDGACVKRCSQFKFRRSFSQTPLAPNSVDSGVDEEFEDEGCQDSANHWRGDSLENCRSHSCRPQDGSQSNAHGGKCHELWPQSFCGALHNCLVQIQARQIWIRSFRFLVSKIQIQEHENSRFRIDAKERDNAHPYRNAHVVSEQIDKPDGAYCREWHGKGDDEGFHHRPGVEVQQQENHSDQPFFHSLCRFVLSAPCDHVTCRKLEFVRQHPQSLFDIIARGAVGNIDEDIARQRAIFIADHCGSGKRAHGGQLGERDLPFARDGNLDLAEGFEIGAEVPHVAHVDGVARASGNDGAYVFPTNCRGQDILRVFY